MIEELENAFMSIATLPPITGGTFAFPQPKRWTVAEFHQLRGEPWMESKPLILVEGEILTMPNPDPPHDASLGLLEDLLRVAFGRGYWIRPQMALVLGLATDPVPDIAVVVGSPRDYQVHPRTALLVAEVSATTLNYDLGDKSHLYAAASILDYWIVDLLHRRLVVHRDPIADAAATFGARYKSVVSVDPAGSVAPIAAPSASVAVRDVLT